MTGGAARASEWEELAVSDPGALRESIRERHREDFSAGRTQLLSGWVLSETELRLCALVAVLFLSRDGINCDRHAENVPGCQKGKPPERPAPAGASSSQHGLPSRDGAQAFTVDELFKLKKADLLRGGHPVPEKTLHQSDLIQIVMCDN